MDLTFPINFIGHDAWMASGYALELASGDVIARDGEFLGTWRVVDYDLENDEVGGRYKLIADGDSEPSLTKVFIFLD